MKTKRKIITSTMVAILLLSFLGYRIVYINDKYPPPQYSYHNMNAPVKYGQFELSVVGYSFMSANQIKDVFEDEIGIGLTIKSLVLDFTVKNTGNTTAQIELYNFILESGYWMNGINLKVFMDINEGNEKMTLSPKLQPGESLSIKLPFHMTSNQFKSNQWNNVEKQNYLLVLSLYPVKAAIKLTS